MRRRSLRQFLIAAGQSLRRRLAFDSHGPRFVLGANIAALNFQPTLIIDADKNPGARHVGRIIDRKALVDRGDRLFEFAKAPIDLFGEFLHAFIFVRERPVFGKNRVVTRLLLFCQRRLCCRQTPQACRMPVGEIDREFAPFPTLGANTVGLLGQLFARQPIQQRRVLKPAAGVAGKEIAQNSPARRPHRPRRRRRQRGDPRS